MNNNRHFGTIGLKDTCQQHIMMLLVMFVLVMMPSQAWSVDLLGCNSALTKKHPYLAIRINNFMSGYGDSRGYVRFFKDAYSDDAYQEVVFDDEKFLWERFNSLNDNEIVEVKTCEIADTKMRIYFQRRTTDKNYGNGLAIYMTFDSPGKLLSKYNKVRFYFQYKDQDEYHQLNGDSDHEITNELPVFQFKDMFSWTMEPTLDVTADEEHIGQALCMLQTSDTCVAKCFIDGKDLKINNGFSSQFTLPNDTSFTVDINDYSVSQYAFNDSSHFDHFYQNAGTLTRKPFLAILKPTVTAKDGHTSTGENTRSNVIKWYVASDPANDIWPSDQFIVLRSSDESFSDPATVTTVALSAYTNKDSHGYYYVVNDESEEAQYSKSNDSIYYRIVRAIVYAQWNSHRGDYCQTVSIMPDNYTPVVSSITVSKKDANFENNKTVKVRVDLYNSDNTIVSYRNYLQANASKQWVSVQDGFLVMTGNEDSKAKFMKQSIDATRFCLVYDGKIIGFEETSGNRYLQVGKGTPAIFDFTSGNGLLSVSNANGSVGCSTLGLRIYSYNCCEWNEQRQETQTKSVCLFDTNTNITITRYSPKDEWYEGKDYAAKTITILGDDVKFDKANNTYYAEVEDVQNAPYTHYYYKATLDNTSGNYNLLRTDTVTTTAKEADACYSKSIAQIQGITATRGTARGRVVVTWSVGNGENTGYKVWKREYEQKGEQPHDWQSVTLSDQRASSYTDMTAYPGKAYEYMVCGYLECRGKTYTTDTVRAAGYSSYYGRTGGKLLMSDGSAVPYKTTVAISLRHVASTATVPSASPEVTATVSSASPEVTATVPSASPEVTTILTDLTIPTITARDNADSIIMPGIATIHKGDTLMKIYTQPDGSFQYDSIPYLATDQDLTKYDITVLGDVGSDIKNPSGQSGAYTLTFTDNTFEHSNLKFVTDKVHTFQGRILFANSTIPSRGIQFYVSRDKDGKDKTPLLDLNGDPVVSDNDGNYKFSVPDGATNFIQAYKKGHTLYKDGIFSYQELILKGDKGGTLFDIADSTTVRLVGRLVGGDIQGDKPLAFGQSRNNLGDNLRLVMTLEGDNTSYITYNEKDPDNTTRTATFTQCVTDASGNKTYVDPTSVTFQRKRIIITPDVTTGEFAIDLPPTKYKVTELSAKGYSTLFTEGEGFAVLDLTNDTVAHTYLSGMKESPSALYTTYHHAYNRIYHAPVHVTYQQYVGGMPTEYFGTKELTAQTIYGKDIKTLSYQKGRYIFGHPVYQQGSTYQMQVRAHEDYYYNNDNNTLPDEVPLQGAVLHVDNGFLSSDCNKDFELDTLGQTTFYIMADNVSYNLIGEAEVRVLNMQAEKNGYYYDATPLKAYITGSRSTASGTLGTDVTTRTINKDITLLDIIRDPYTSTGYTYRERGTQYTWSRTLKTAATIDCGISTDIGSQSTVIAGAWAGVGAGGYTGSTFGGSSVATVSLKLPTLLDWSYNHIANYTMTFNERIQTSADPKDVGAMADVYVGIVNTMQLKKEEAFNILDDTTYLKLEPSFKSGKMKVVAEGTDSLGNKYYLATGEQYTVSDSIPTKFVYTQKHIINNVLPNLMKELTSYLVNDTQENVQTLADTNHKVYYRLTRPECYNLLWPADSAWYEIIKPAGNTGNVVDEVSVIANTIRSWLSLIKINEEHKLNYKTNATLLKNYSISGASIDYTEEDSYYQKIWGSGSLVGFDVLRGTISTKIGASASGSGLDKNLGVINTETQSTTYCPNYTADNDKAGLAEVTTTVDVPGVKFKFHFTPSVVISFDNATTKLTTRTAGSGFHMGNSSDEYLNVSVYEEKVVESNTEGVSTAEQEWEWSSDDWDWILKSNNMKDSITGRSHDFIFVVTGGANHSPWYGADSTLCAQLQLVNGELKGTPLGATTLKMDNPKIYLDNNNVSNLPKTERAVFSLTLANESEYKGAARPATLNLYVDQDSNPYGARLYVDGAAIGNGLQFLLEPGESVVKTLEVERGTKAYDYENIRLVFEDEYLTVNDKQVINVHYLPEATPVKITSPTDKWVLNTLSSRDEDGKYYLPVTITGFDVNSENFDHIEFQYKKQTEGDASWVNLCSYYARNDEYYKKATGTKKLLSSGSISDQCFYGEKDPMEMKYDLRAVSFNRLGNGYVTCASNVVSGTKDTRCPEIFGTPSPKGGILGVDDVLSLKFSEEIAYNYLDKTANFQVTGYTNTSASQQQTFYMFDKKATASTTLRETFKERAFTFEMMAYFPAYLNNTSANPSSKAELVSVVDPTGNKKNMQLTVEGNTLVLYCDGSKIAQSGEAEELKSLGSKAVHVGVAYCMNDTTVHFIVGDAFKDNVLKQAKKDILIDVNGLIQFTPQSCAGTIYNLRLWDRYMDEQAAPYKGEILTGTERYLLCYWPMNEGAGNVAKEKVYGMNMQLANGEWHLTDGYSLHLKNRTVSLKNTEKILRNSYQDFSVGFWVRRTAPSLNANSQKVDTTQIVRVGAADNPLKFIYTSNEGDYINLVNKKVNLPLLSGSETENFSQWHHVMLTVDHKNDVAAAYIDGQLVQSFAADSISPIESSDFILGDENASMCIDGIEFWQMALPAYYIADGYNSKCEGTEMGLAIYLPFEKTVKTPEGYVQQLSLDNIAEKDTDLQCMIAETVTDISTNLTTTGKVLEATTYQCPCKASEGLQTLPITWSSTGTELQINVDRSDKDLNGRTINVTVRGVEDLAGNVMANPKMWSAYVNRNALKWSDKTIAAHVCYGEAATLSAEWENITGKSLDYTIDNSASWLTISRKSGTAEPLDKQTVKFEVSDGLAPGSYSTVAYLTDEEGLSMGLKINITVTATEPDWEVVSSSDYNQTMNIIAVVKQKADNGRWVVVNDKQDIVGAFINDVCVGKANITVDAENGLSRLYMTVRGNSSCNKKQIKFYLWDSSTGKRQRLSIYNSEEEIYSDTVFTKNAILGIDAPLDMRTSTSMFQYIDLAQGWNWVSFNVKPTGTGFGTFFYNTDFTNGDIITIPGSSSFYSYDATSKSWGDGMLKLDKSNICQIYAQNAMMVNVTGEDYEDSTRYVVVNVPKANGWTPLAYLLNVSQTLKQALTDFKIGESGKCAPGSVIKSFNQFAVATADGKWVGSLTYMRPGEGYFLRSAKPLDHDTIYYTNNTVSGTKAAWNGLTEESRASEITGNTGNSETSGASGAGNREHNSSMPVIATFADGTAQAGDVLVAYSDGEVVGSAEYDADAQLFFLSVNAEPKSSIRFAKVCGTTVEAVTSKTLDYQPNGVIGSLAKPYLVEFDATGIDTLPPSSDIPSCDVSQDKYDIMGRKYRDFKDIQSHKGIYIIDGKKVTR